MDGKGHDQMTFKRNLHFLGVPLLIDGRSACLFFRQTRVHDAMLLPEREIFEFYPTMQLSNENHLKLIFSGSDE